MRCGVIARKLGMSRIFNDDGEHVPVTVLRIEDVEVLSVKSIAKDGYTSVQLGFSNKKSKNISKPLRGFFAKAKAEPKEKVVEFRVSEDATLNVGDKLGVNHFVNGHAETPDVGTLPQPHVAVGRLHWLVDGLRRHEEQRADSMPTNDEIRAFPDHRRLQVTFRKGLNQLVFKIQNREGRWKFCCRLLEKQPAQTP